MKKTVILALTLIAGSANAASNEWKDLGPIPGLPEQLLIATNSKHDIPYVISSTALSAYNDHKVTINTPVNKYVRENIPFPKNEEKNNHYVYRMLKDDCGNLYLVISKDNTMHQTWRYIPSTSRWVNISPKKLVLYHLNSTFGGGYDDDDNFLMRTPDEINVFKNTKYTIMTLSCYAEPGDDGYQWQKIENSNLGGVSNLIVIPGNKRYTYFVGGLAINVINTLYKKYGKAPFLIWDKGENLHQESLSSASIADAVAKQHPNYASTAPVSIASTAADANGNVYALVGFWFYNKGQTQTVKNSPQVELWEYQVDTDVHGWKYLGTILNNDDSSSQNPGFDKVYTALKVIKTTKGTPVVYYAVASNTESDPDTTDLAPKFGYYLPATNTLQPIGYADPRLNFRPSAVMFGHLYLANGNLYLFDPNKHKLDSESEAMSPFWILKGATSPSASLKWENQVSTVSASGATITWSARPAVQSQGRPYSDVKRPLVALQASDGDIYVTGSASHKTAYHLYRYTP